MSDENNEQETAAKIFASVSRNEENSDDEKIKSAEIKSQKHSITTQNDSFWENVDFSLSEQLIDKDYHPVLIFGTRASGKTTLLTSLISYMNYDPDSPGICHLGEEIVPNSSRYGIRVLAEAKDIFYNDVPNFHRGIAAKRTRLENPIFIPLKFMPKVKAAAAKIALLETEGEFFQVDSRERRGELILKNEIIDIYKYFPERLSIIIVAPFCLSSRYEEPEESEAEKEEIERSDSSLAASLQKYLDYRAEKYRENDRFIFVLTKWDEFTGGATGDNFLTPPQAIVEQQIENKFQMSWSLYKNMPIHGARNSLHYCSGIIAGNDRLPTPASHKKMLSTFPRSLWKWIYLNATTGSTSENKEPEKSRIKGFIRGLLG